MRDSKMKGNVALLVTAATFLCFANASEDASPIRQLIRGGAPFVHAKDYKDDTGANDNEERDLGRVKARNGGGGNSDSSDDSSSKGSKGGSSSKGSKGSKSSKSGSKGSKGRSGRRRRRRSGPSCGIDCGNKDYAYIYLEGSYFFGFPNDNSTNVVPIEGTGIFNSTKDGSTIRIYEQDLKGYAKYFDHGDAYPYQNDIHGSVSGSCTILATYPGVTTQVASELCLAHCTICVAYEGRCCDKSGGSEYDESGHPWTTKVDTCESYGGYATMTGDLLFALEFAADGSLISIPDGGLVSLEGLGVITGTALELSTAKTGGLGYIEYDALDRNDGDVYKIGLKVPFNDQASCKLQNHLDGFDLPPLDSPPTPIRIPSPTPRPTQPPTGDAPTTANITGTVKDNFGNALVGVNITLEFPDGSFVASTETDAAGVYEFTKVTPGNYIIIETNPLSHPLSITDFDTTSDGDENEGDTSGDNMIAVTVDAGKLDNGNDFVDAALPAIVGTVQDNFGVALSTVNITLEQPDGTVVATTLTDAAGIYEFTGLDPGNYVIRETNPASHPYSVTDFDTVADGDPNEGDTTGDDTILVSLGPGEVDTGNDFVDAAPAEITGTVKDNFGSPLVKVNITLEQSDGTFVANTETDAAGVYEFTGLPPGNYTICETNPASHPVSISDNDTTDDGDPGDSDTTVDDKIEVVLGFGEVDSGNDFVDAVQATTTPEAIPTNATTPQVTTPDATTPQATTPGATTPEATTPEGTTPEATTPEATTPEVTTPEATTLFATTTALCIPNSGADCTSNADCTCDSICFRGKCAGFCTDPPRDTGCKPSICAGDCSNNNGNCFFTCNEVCPPCPPGKVRTDNVDSVGNNDCNAGEATCPGNNKNSQCSGQGNEIGNVPCCSCTDSGCAAICVDAPTTEAITTTTFAVKPATILGSVKDTLGNGLSLVDVKLQRVGDEDGVFVAETQTDDNGNYTFTGVEPGDYFVCEVNPASHPISVTDYDTTIDGDANEGDTTGDDKIAVSVEAGEIDSGNDFVDAVQTTTTTTGAPDVGTTTSAGPESLLKPCGGIVISEIMYDPSLAQGGDREGEWVEIFNSGCNPGKN